MKPFPKSSPVSGADWFMLAMDPHMTRFKQVGNVCRYVLFINGRLEEKLLRERLSEKKVFAWLANLYIRKNGPLSLATWDSMENDRLVRFEVHACDDDKIPQAIMERDISIDEEALFQIDLVQRPQNKTTFIFSWHHILMDGRGAGLLLKYLNGDVSLDDPLNLIPKATKPKSFYRNWNNMMLTKEFLKESSHKPLATFINPGPIAAPESKYRVIKFSVAETQLIHTNAQNHGARFGHSSFYLATVTRAANSILKTRGTHGNPFWVPVPQDDRLRGATGPLITNQLSFIFYRLPVHCLSSVAETVKEINRQLVEQIKSGIPKNYAGMMDWFRRLPLKPYYQLIKGPAGGSIASFLFSVAADSQDELRKFFGHEVEDAINFPPNTYPPGFTTVFMRFNGTLKLILVYVEQAISTAEVSDFEELVKKDLMEGDITS